MIKLRRIDDRFLSRRYHLHHVPRDSSKRDRDLSSISRRRAMRQLVDLVGIGDAWSFIHAADSAWESGDTGWAVQYDAPQSSKLWLRIELVANGDAPFVAMFEPTGMTYDLAGGERMFADILRQDTADFQIVNWNGGISIWSPGPVLT